MPDPLAVAVELAREVGALLLGKLRQPREIEEKALRADLVTDADRASEALIVRRLRGEFPRATIVTEESGTHRGESEERWIIDPLDGTTNFAHGYPLFCVSIACERAGELIAGVVHAPAMDECFAAERGTGARLNDRPIRVSAIERLGDAMTCTGFYPARFERNARQFAAVSRRAQAVRRDGAAALDLAYVACGRFDGFWEFDLHPWDTAAGVLLIREAGGRVSQIDGSPFSFAADSTLATNGRIHDELGGVLKAA